MRGGGGGAAAMVRWIAAMALPALVLLLLVSVESAAGDAGADESGVGAPMHEMERLRSSLESKEAHIAKVEQELAGLREQKRGGAELEAMAERVRELESRAAEAVVQMEQAHKYAEALRRRAESAEERARELDGRHERAQAAAQDAKKRARDSEKALRAAEATVAEAERRLQAHGEELLRVHGQWLPPWAAAQVGILRAGAASRWKAHGKPMTDALGAKWGGAAARVGPEVRRRYEAAAEALAPHAEGARAAAVRGYEVLRRDYIGRAQEFMRPHLSAAVEGARPYAAMVQERARPYVDQLAAASVSSMERARGVVGPYLERVPPFYRGAVSAAARGHETLQEKVRERLAKHEAVASFFPDEVVWLLAAGLLALPVVAVLYFLSSVLRTKAPPRRGASLRSSAASGGRHKRAKKVDK